MTAPQSILGIDMGGTNIRGGIVKGGNVARSISQKIYAQGSETDVRNELFRLIDQFMAERIDAIGIGVPGLIDAETGNVFDVVNIPSWKKVPLKKWIQDRYSIPAEVNNDANCFALGEHYFGKGKNVQSMVGVTLGTGLGSGIIINQHLYSGRNGGAGEFGMIDYKSRPVEYFASGQFFENMYDVTGETVFRQAQAGDSDALRMYREMGTHLGKAIKMILFALDVELIVLGGSVRSAWEFFRESMWEEIKTFPFTRALQHLRIEISELENAGMLGAAALCLEKHYEH